MSDTYSTIAEPAEGLYREKGSRFLAYAFPVQSEQEVKRHVEAIRQEHYGARHHCYAYRIGKDGARFRANDDGEPSGTAGKPILGQLLSAGLTNVLMVVTRYFGGTLLGTSGLIAAYRSAAAAAVANARVVQRTWDVELSAAFPYARLNEVMRLVKEEQLRVLSQDFGGEQCAICVSVRESRAQRVRERLGESGCGDL